jgi:hypothetical protein
MRLILDIPESKSTFFLELLKNFSFIKTTVVSTSSDVSLSVAEKDAIDVALRDLEKESVHNHADVLQEMKAKYPNLF